MYNDSRGMWRELTMDLVNVSFVVAETLCPIYIHYVHRFLRLAVVVDLAAVGEP